MINARRILVATALLLICGATVATPAQAQDGCIDGLDGAPVCTPHIGPPPPPDFLRPAPLPSPGLDNSPREAPPYQAPAPVYIAPVPAPVAPAPVYKAPAAQAPVQKIPTPVQGQGAVPVNGIDVVPVPAVAEPVAAPESVQDVVESATTPTVTATPSAAPVAAPISELVVAQGDPVAVGVSPASNVSDSTPVIVAIASVIVLGGVVWLVLHSGPGVAGIRGIARGLLRR